MNMIIDIIMKRDGLARYEVLSLIKETQEAIYDAVSDSDFEQAEQAVMDILGLEPDYLPYFLENIDE